MPQIPAYKKCSGANLAWGTGPNGPVRVGNSVVRPIPPRASFGARGAKICSWELPGRKYFRRASPSEIQQAMLAWEAARMVGLSQCGEAVECNLRPWHPIPIIARSQVFFLEWVYYFCLFVWAFFYCIFLLHLFIAFFFIAFLFLCSAAISWEALLVCGFDADWRRFWNRGADSDARIWVRTISTTRVIRWL